MPKTSLRAQAAIRRGLAGLCLSLALAGTAQAADPAVPRRVTVKLGTADRVVEGHGLPPAPDADPMAGLGLLQRLALLIDMLASGRTEPETGAQAAAPTADGPAEIIPYSGPLAAGTVVINLERFQLYRILEGGWAELHQERSEAAVLAKIGIVRQDERHF